MTTSAIATTAESMTTNRNLVAELHTREGIDWQVAYCELVESILRERDEHARRADAAWDERGEDKNAMFHFLQHDEVAHTLDRMANIADLYASIVSIN